VSEFVSIFGFRHLTAPLRQHKDGGERTVEGKLPSHFVSSVIGILLICSQILTPSAEVRSFTELSVSKLGPARQGSSPLRIGVDARYVSCLYFLKASELD
jgi:hypothetical protein